MTRARATKGSSSVRGRNTAPGTSSCRCTPTARRRGRGGGPTRRCSIKRDGQMDLNAPVFESTDASFDANTREDEAPPDTLTDADK